MFRKCHRDPQTDCRRPCWPVCLCGMLLACLAAPARCQPHDGESSTPITRIGIRVVPSRNASSTDRKEATGAQADVRSALSGAECRIGLGEALGLAGVENPTIARALEAVRASEAELLQARSLLLPTLRGGVSVNSHEGNLLSGRGIMRNLDRESVYEGAGLSAVGAGTVTIPGVWLFAPLADAVFAPRIAREVVVSQEQGAEATRNGVLLEVAGSYLRLLGATARLQAIHRTERELDGIVKMTTNFARTGAGREGDANRARTEALLLHQQAQSAEEDGAVASADLARLLNRDPAVRLRPAEVEIPLLRLVDPNLKLEALLEIAQQNRPEVRARTAAVMAAEARLRQERVRPLLPVLSVGYSAGNFGGGSDQTTPRFGRYDGRGDVDVVAYWSLQNLGLGNLAIQRERRAEVNQAEAELARVRNQINQEVVDAYATSEARRRDFDVARQRVSTMLEGFRLDLERARNLEGRGRPIEVLNSLTLLNRGRQELVQAVIGYLEAQFQLFVSLGQPPDLALARGLICP